MKRKIVVVSIFSAALWAQNPDVAKPGADRRMTVHIAGLQESGAIGLQTAIAGPAATITGSPYSAEAVTERIQPLPDGNRIVQTTSSLVARDSQGRVRRDESLGINLAGGKEGAPKIETIDDPVAGVHWILDPQEKTAVKATMPKRPGATFNSVLPPPGPDKTWFYSSGTPGAQITFQTLATRQSESDTNVSRTDLGTQSIEGVSAQGTRVARTLPAGAVGNEQPIVITTETWYSPDLKVLVMSKAEDPRMGTTTYRLTNIQRGEPLVSLFEVPSDFTVKDQGADVLFYKQVKKQD